MDVGTGIKLELIDLFKKLKSSTADPHAAYGLPRERPEPTPTSSATCRLVRVSASRDGTVADETELRSDRKLWLDP